MTAPSARGRAGVSAGVWRGFHLGDHCVVARRISERHATDVGDRFSVVRCEGDVSIFGNRRAERWARHTGGEREKPLGAVARQRIQWRELSGMEVVAASYK